MTARRVLGSMLATTLIATPAAILVTAAPAAAVTPTAIVPSSGTSWISLNSQSQPGAPVSGDTLYFYIDVAATDGSTDPYAGTVTVERALEGETTWTVIGTSQYAGFSGSTKLVRNATYRVTYSGGASGTSSWAPAEATQAVTVQRKIDLKNVGGRKVVMRGKVSPAYQGKVTIVKQAGKKWKKWKVVRTNKKGVFKTALPAPKRGRYYWRVLIKAGGGYAASDSGKVYTYSY